MPKLTRIEKRAKLDALFDTGGYVYFTVENGVFTEHTEDEAQPSDLKIWVRPCDPFQRDQVVRESQAARARLVLASKEVDSIDWVSIRAYVASLSLDAVVEYVIDLDEQERLSEARRDVLKEPEWDDFNQLRDAMRQFEESGASREDEEWAPLIKRDLEFGAQVNDIARDLRQNAWGAMHLMPREELDKRAFDKRVEQAGSGAFVREYESGVLFYACRDDENHNELYFDSIRDLRSQPQELQDALASKLAKFITDAAEAKNSQGAAPSSVSSEPSAAPETSEPSGPEASTE